LAALNPSYHWTDYHWTDPRETHHDGDSGKASMPLAAPNSSYPLLGSTLDEAMNFGGPALVDVRILQDFARKPQEFGWQS